MSLRPRLITLGLLLAALLVGATGVGPGASAWAHAGLIDSDPREGSVLDKAPDWVTLTFGEPVTVLPGATLFTPDNLGHPVQAEASEERAVYDVGALGEGSHALAWRVLSADGHVVSGTLSFAVGHETSLELPAPDEPATATGVLVGQTLTQLGVLLAVGLAWSGEAVRRRLRPVLVLAVATTVVGGWLLVCETYAWTGRWSLDLGVVVGALALGTLAMHAWVPLRAVGTLALAVALAATGHPRGADLAILASLADVAHVVAAGVWIGGLLGIVLVLPRTDDATRLAVVAAFSRRTSWALGVVAVSGLVLAQQVLGEWGRLPGTEHGRWLLAKVAVVAVAVTLGALHRRALRRGDLAAAPTGRWRRSLVVELVLLLVVVVITGFLTQASPRPPLPERVAAVVEVGDDDVEVALVPGVVGVNRVEVRVRDERGLWVPLVEAPQLALRPADAPGAAPLGGAMQDLGDVAILTVTVPEAGAWAVQLPLRFSRDDAPVVKAVVDVVDAAGRG